MPGLKKEKLDKQEEDKVIGIVATVPDSRAASELAKLAEIKPALQRGGSKIETETRELQEIMASKKKELLQNKQGKEKPAIEKGTDTTPTIPRPGK